MKIPKDSVPYVNDAMEKKREIQFLLRKVTRDNQMNFVIRKSSKLLNEETEANQKLRKMIETRKLVFFQLFFLFFKAASVRRVWIDDSSS